MSRHLLNVIKSMIHYEVDRRPDLELRIDKDPLLKLDSNKFTTDLYVSCPEQLEVHVADAVRRKEPVIVVSAPFGWGKSSLVAHVRYRLNATSPEIQQIYLDVKSTHSPLFRDNCTIEHVAEAVKMCVEQRLFPVQKDAATLMSTLISGSGPQTSEKSINRALWSCRAHAVIAHEKWCQSYRAGT